MTPHRPVVGLAFAKADRYIFNFQCFNYSTTVRSLSLLPILYINKNICIYTAICWFWQWHTHAVFIAFIASCFFGFTYGEREKKWNKPSNDDCISMPDDQKCMQMTNVIRSIRITNGSIKINLCVCLDIDQRENERETIWHTKKRVSQMWSTIQHDIISRHRQRFYCCLSVWTNFDYTKKHFFTRAWFD